MVMVWVWVQIQRKMLGSDTRDTHSTNPRNNGL
jgi:hypothetical protein